jgi:PAS domain S-box-containing protein
MWPYFGVVLVLFCFLPCRVGEAQHKLPRLLILYEAGTTYPAVNLIDQGIRDVLDTSPDKLETYREYMDTFLFPEPTDQQQFRDFYIRKYKNRRPDVIITAGPSPLKFMVESHTKFFSGVPIVFCIPDWTPAISTLSSEFTGVGDDLAVTETIEAALRLQPRTQNIVVVGGTSYIDESLQAVVKEQLKPYERDYQISYLTNLAMPDLVERLKHLPNRTIVLLGSLSQDASGTKFISARSSAIVAAAASVPVFSLADAEFGTGEVGGKLSSIREQGRIAAGLAERLLKGEKPQAIPVVKSPTIYMFDWKVMQRWGLKESNLPPGSIVVNRPISFWELYKRYVILGAFVLLAQTGVILGLLWQRRRKLRAEGYLRASEETFSKCFRQSPLVIAISRTSDSRFIDVNQSFEEQFGWTRDEVIGRTPGDCDLWVDADQRSTFLEQLRTNGSVRNLEVSLRKRGGETRIALVSAELIEVGGEPCTVSVAADITERKRAEEVLSTVSRKLIEAHEEERTRIARELHDDINQRLALLAVKLSSVKQEIPGLSVLGEQYVNQVGQEVSDLGKDIQALSHRLHSSKLEYLGLAVAAGGFCKEFSQRNNVAVEYRHHNIPRNLSPEISLCLFRVLQEALQNALKYSGVQRFEASLESASNEIHLIVRDSGVGFDPESATDHHGLGLISMRERLKLVDGQLSIESKPECGTTIHASAPLKSKVQSEVQVRIATV